MTKITNKRTWIDINLSNLLNNFNTVKNFIGNKTGTILVAKSDCMGFGLVPVVKKAIAAGVEKIAVSELSEALALRQAGITQPILLLYQPLNWEINELIDNNIEISISNPSILPELIQTATAKKKQVNVDLFLETGMHRYGLQKKDLKHTVTTINECPYVTITGISSHFATSDTDTDFAKLQLERFMERIEMVCEDCSTVTSLHISNSAATKLLIESWENDKYKALVPNAKIYIRVCRLLLGATDIQFDPPLRPVFEKVTSQIIEVQSIKKGEFVGYDKTFQADSDMEIATIPVGWANSGYYFRNAYVVVNNTLCRMIGVPSANAMSIENSANAKVGDIVYLIKQDGEGTQFTLKDLAHMNNITHTHITASLGAFIPRIYSE